MSKVFPALDEELRRFIEAQPMFFVGTAPSGSDGRVNISPKGYRDTFTIVDDHTVAYLDLSGSGAETIAHLRQNGRIVVMFCSFDRRSRIVRLHGHGRVVRPDEPEFAEVGATFNLDHPGKRAIIVIEVERISDSCGYSVPYMELKGERPVLDKVQATHSADQWEHRTAEENAHSIDGLPALDPDHPRPTPGEAAAGAGWTRLGRALIRGAGE
ncbi:pyridoxamine 5'-phosphate oxidase family protein [Kitasatospora sp. NPDC097643]|uniref:pyridoxamine 5'-phosphate oxidase family protein n=1 Tax=Kitasatospora sp. NPDC097643 TaxID=3157230 RepID=UPI00331C0019